MKNEQPTLILYAVKNLGRNRKSVWQPIGAAWPHADGKGFNISFDLLPMQGQDLVLREPMLPAADEPNAADATTEANAEQATHDRELEEVPF